MLLSGIVMKNVHYRFDLLVTCGVHLVILFFLIFLCIGVPWMRKVYCCQSIALPDSKYISPSWHSLINVLVANFTKKIIVGILLRFLFLLVQHDLNIFNLITDNIVCFVLMERLWTLLPFHAYSFINNDGTFKPCSFYLSACLRQC